MDYPDLSKYGYIAGRCATEQDVIEGRAAFLLQSGDISQSTPLNIEIPQYAIHIDPYSLEETAGVIIQAEQIDDQQLAGFIPFNSGVPITTSLSEFKLLGRVKPSH